jgi:protein-disulfide isomerase
MTPVVKRNLPFLIIAAVLVIGASSAALLLRWKPTSPRQAGPGKPGAEPPHLRGSPDAPVLLEEFGDFECMPCFMLWPALRNLEHEYGGRLAVKFTQHPLPQHTHALEAARAAEAAGLQGKFWEMHDVLYLQRGSWLRAPNLPAAFEDFAKNLRLDLSRFKRDIAGSEISARIAADEVRGESLGIDRTPVVFINGRRVQLEGDVEQGLRTQIEAALKPSQAEQQ